MSWTPAAALLVGWLVAITKFSTLAGLVHLLPTVAFVLLVSARPAQRSTETTAAPLTRLAFVDRARAFAVALMVPTHAVNALLADAYRHNDLFYVWRFASGLAVVLFLGVAGFVVGVRPLSVHSASTRVWSGLTRRWRRCAVLVATGYAMHLPSLDLPSVWADPSRWARFVAVDVLQTMGLGLAVLAVVDAWCRRRLASQRLFISCATTAAALVVIATPAIVSRPWHDVWPTVVASYLSTARGSLFPLVPWSAYLFAGAALGAMTSDVRDESRLSVRFAALGGGLVLVGLLVAASPLWPPDRPGFWSVSPAMFLVKFGLVALVLATTSASPFVARPLSPVARLWSEHSLFIYLWHVFLIYGSVVSPGLVRLTGTSHGPLMVLVMCAGLLAVSTWAASLWSRLSAGHAAPRG
ncbi:MAG: heparan-alpha-glucosaminide N-acetyltransferase domain-containing protein [Vicinamibacterales bacterium]